MGAPGRRAVRPLTVIGLLIALGLVTYFLLPRDDTPDSIDILPWYAFNEYAVKDLRFSDPSTQAETSDQPGLGDCTESETFDYSYNGNVIPVTYYLKEAGIIATFKTWLVVHHSDRGYLYFVRELEWTLDVSSLGEGTQEADPQTSFIATETPETEPFIYDETGYIFNGLVMRLRKWVDGRDIKARDRVKQD